MWKVREQTYTALWTSAQVAKFYGYDPPTIGNWRKQGLIPYVELITGEYRYDNNKVRQAMEVCTNENA